MLIDLATLPETASEYFLILGGRTGLKISKKSKQTAEIHISQWARKFKKVHAKKLV